MTGEKLNADGFSMTQKAKKMGCHNAQNDLKDWQIGETRLVQQVKPLNHRDII